MNNKDMPAMATSSNGMLQEGLTKREYAAIHIMAGFASHQDQGKPEDLVRHSLRCVDALFNELDKGNE